MLKCIASDNWKIGLLTHFLEVVKGIIELLTHFADILKFAFPLATL